MYETYFFVCLRKARAHCGGFIAGSGISHNRAPARFG
jgi:hypothetical protein